MDSQNERRAAKQGRDDRWDVSEFSRSYGLPGAKERHVCAVSGCFQRFLCLLEVEDNKEC